jgi:hypothetical protein
MPGLFKLRKGDHRSQCLYKGRKRRSRSRTLAAVAGRRQQLACRSASSKARGTRQSSADSCTMGCSGWICMAAGRQHGEGLVRSGHRLVC